MGSNAPNSQHSHIQYHHLRGNRQPTADPSAEMDSKATKTKDFATSVYPSPADDVQSTFSAPSSPVFSEQHVARPSPQEKITLPPLSSIMQMPSPSSSPRLPLASYSPASDFLYRPSKYDDSSHHVGRGSLAFDHGKDAQLFSDQQNARDKVAQPQPLFPTQTRPEQGQAATASHDDQEKSAAPTKLKPTKFERLPERLPFYWEPPRYGPFNKRQRKRPVENNHLRDPPPPGTGYYGRNDIWARQGQDPYRYLLPHLLDTFPLKDSSSTPPLAQPPQNNTSASSMTSTKRKADAAADMPPPKRQLLRKDSANTRQSISPREAPMDAPEKTRVRRAEPSKSKVPRASSERIQRNYSVYPDYCPPLSTLDGDDVAFPNIDWKAASQDMSKHEDSHLLHSKEIAVASKLVLTPSVYLYIKRRFFANRLEYARRHQVFNINAAQLACKGLDEHGITGIDVNKTSRLHKAFDKVGWLDEKHMDRFLA